MTQDIDTVQIEDIDTKTQVHTKLSQLLVSLKRDPTIEIKPTIEYLIQDLQAIFPDMEKPQDYFWRPTETSEIALKYIQKRMDDPGIPGFETGFAKLDDMVGGWEPENIYMVNARSGVGKTTLLLQFAWFLARQTTVIYFSPEARISLLSRRLIGALAGVPNSDIRRGNISKQQYDNLQKGAALMKSRPLYFYDMPEISTRDMDQIIERVQRETGHPVGGIFLDYLQQMEGEDSFDKITNNMKKLETLIVKRKLAAIMASQVGRANGDGSAVDAGKGSGKIEELSSVVFGFTQIYDNKGKLSQNPEDKLRRMLFCSKNREEGIQFQLPLLFDRLTGWLKEEKGLF